MTNSGCSGARAWIAATSSIARFSAMVIGRNSGSRNPRSTRARTWSRGNFSTVAAKSTEASRSFASRRVSSQSPQQPPLPPLAPREVAGGLEHPAGHSRRGGPPERLGRKENERRAEQGERDQRDDPIVDQRSDRERSPDRPGTAEDHAHGEDRQDISEEGLRERIHSEQLVGEGVLEKSEHAPHQDRARGIPAARDDGRRDQETRS